MSGYGFNYSGDAGGGGHTTTTPPSRPGTSSGGGGNRRSYDDQTLIPVTIRMILRAQTQQTPGGSSESLMLEDGRTLHHIVTVGAIRSLIEQSTNVVYEVEDGTGLIDVKQWLDAGENSGLTEMRMQCKDNMYVKVIGQIREYEGRRQIISFSMRPLNSPNELTHHFLHSVYSMEKSKRELTSPNSVTHNVSGGMMGGGGIVKNEYGMQSGGGGGNNLFSAPPSQQHSMQANSNQHHQQQQQTPPVVNDVMEYIKREGAHSDMGCNLSDNLIPDLRNSKGYNEGDIRHAIDLLSNDGMIYSTVNENMFKWAE